MKKLYSFILCFFLQLSSFAQQGWFNQNSGTTNNLNSVFFINDSIGWIAGDGGKILKTTNGGENWINQNTNINNSLLSINFIDQNIGWAIGAHGAIIKTTNGGNDWINQSIGIDYELKSIKFIDENIGWAVGFYYSSALGIILKTTNGGTDWSTQTILSQTGLISVDFVDENNGWIAGWHGRIQKTTNGGLNWVTSQLSTYNYLFSICFINENIGWVSGQVQTIYKTTDGGVNWISQYSGINSLLRSIHFVDQNYGWAAGAGPTGGSILFTTDGGINWAFQKNDVINLYSIYFINHNKGWAVGEQGNILHTTNGGNLQLIDLLLPNGGENIMGNSEYEIRWTSQDIDSVNIYLSLDNGTNWKEIELQYPSYNTTNNGYLWKVPDTTSNLCLIKIENFLNDSIFDISDHSFSIIDSVTSVYLNYNQFNFFLTQNYPNPFNPTTKIKYQIPKKGFISLKVFDLLGREAATLVNAEKPAGSYEVEFDGSNLSSGIYFYKLQAGDYNEIKKMILLK